jgi:hypothetical protein
MRFYTKHRVFLPEGVLFEFSMPSSKPPPDSALLLQELALLPTLNLLIPTDPRGDDMGDNR